MNNENHKKNILINYIAFIINLKDQNRNIFKIIKYKHYAISVNSV